MRNINFPFNSRPYPGGGLASFQEGDLVDEGGLASIIEGAETEEEEETTLEQIIRYLFQHSGILPEGMSLEGLLGGEGMAGLLGEEEMAHGDVVPGTNPIQGQKDGPTVGYQGEGGMPSNVQQMMAAYKAHQAGEISRQDLNSILGDTSNLNSILMRNLQQQQVAPAAPAPTPDPVGPQTFGDLQTASAVGDPFGAYVAGSPSREQLLAQYFPPPSAARQQQQTTGLPQLTEEQLLRLSEVA
jgi:hypothetical protein